MSGDLDARALKGLAGKRLLLVNKRNRPLSVALPTDFTADHVAMVAAGVSLDTAKWQGEALALPPFAVATVLGK